MSTKFVVNCDNFDGHSKTILYNGVCPYSGKTEQEFINEGYKVVDDNEFIKLVSEFESSLCNKWFEISEDFYEEQLNCLPPVQWMGGGFFMSERYYGEVTGFYQRLDGKFYTSLQNMFTSRDEILDNLRKAIKDGKVKKDDRF